MGFVGFLKFFQRSFSGVLYAQGWGNDQDFFQAIIQKDTQVLKSISGLGGKLGETVVVELSSKAKLKQLETIAYKATDVSKVQPTDLSKRNQAIEGLIGMGYGEREAMELVTQILKKEPEASLEDIIRLVLQQHQV